MKRIFFAVLLLMICATAYPQSIIMTRRRGPSAAPPATISAADTFSRGDADPMTLAMSDGVSIWTNGPGTMENCRIATANLFQVSVGTGLESGCMVLYPTFPAKQYASVTFNASPFECAIGVRMQSAAVASGYIGSAVDSTHVRISKMTDTGTFAYSTLATFAVASVGTGNQIRLDATGTTLTIYLDGVSVGSTTDATWSGGQPFCYLFGPSASMNSFSAVGTLP